MSTVCRCCLLEGTSMKNLFSFRIKSKNGEEDLTFADAFNLSTNLNLNQNSKLSNDICLNCEEKLIASYEFRIQCRTANTMLNLRCSEFSNMTTDDVDVVEDEDFWDAEFLYNVPSLCKEDFFGEEIHSSDNLLSTCEINSTDVDILVENPANEEPTIKEQSGKTSTEKKPSFKCSGCERSFFKHSFYRIHSEKFHNSDWECEFCNERFTAQTYLVHKRIHTTEPIFQCNLCNGIYLSKPSLSKHRCPLIKPEEIDVKPEIILEPTVELVKFKFTCNVCNEDFTCNKKYKIHIKQHEKLALKSKTDKGYLCNFCGMNLTRADSLVDHIRTHTGEKPYGCDICGQFFRQRCSLRNHKQLHTGKKTMCELCPKTFASKAFLRLHMRSHNNERNFKCEVCNKSYLMKHALKEHNREHHSTIRLKCSYCHKDFANPSMLRLHETIHTGKRWWCPQCTYKSTTRTTLRKHIFSVHKLNIDDLDVKKNETGADSVKSTIYIQLK